MRGGVTTPRRKLTHQQAWGFPAGLPRVTGTGPAGGRGVPGGYRGPVPPRPSPAAPVGTVTRGTTGTNRLRRVDRWLAGVHGPRLRRAADPVVADLGFGAVPTTTVELLQRLRPVRADVRVVGVEIDPERVRTARELAPDGPRFVVGGFELPLPDGARPVLVRALNVLRQYPEEQVAGAWELLGSRLAPGGRLVEGTCDETGRLASWVDVGPDGRPRCLTISLRLAGLERPSQVAARLPKALIHRNVPGEGVHALLTDLDRAWERHAPLAPLGARQRWLATVDQLAAGWPVRHGPRRRRLGEVTVDWAAVRPGTPPAAG